jgi:hypothetical protein
MNKPDPAKLAEEIAARAAGHVSNAQETFGITFDYSPQSLQLVDHAITKFHGDRAMFDSTIVTYGCYIGETIRRSLGGEWTPGSDDQGQPVLQAVGGSVTVFPIAWAAKRFANGDVDRISFKYTALLSTLGRLEEDPPCLVLPEVENLSFANADDEDGEMTEDADELGATDRIRSEEIIARSPLLVFLLVAAADGRVDKKELLQFQKLLTTASQSQSPLFRQTLNTLPSKLQEYTKSLVEAGAISWMLELVQLSGILDEKHADEAKSFKESLYALAVQVAESAGGGWFGLGQKISEEEKAALDMLRATLGLLEPDGGTT